MAQKLKRIIRRVEQFLFKYYNISLQVIYIQIYIE